MIEADKCEPKAGYSCNGVKKMEKSSDCVKYCDSNVGKKKWYIDCSPMKESPHVIAEFYVNLNKFKIIGLFSIIHVAMAIIEILRLTR